MSGNNDTNKQANQVGAALLGLIIGLSPALILIATFKPDGGPVAKGILIICGIINLFGGFVCVSNAKSLAARIAGGTCLGILFFMLCVGIGIFMACAQGLRNI